MCLLCSSFELIILNFLLCYRFNLIVVNLNVCHVRIHLTVSARLTIPDDHLLVILFLFLFLLLHHIFILINICNDETIYVYNIKIYLLYILCTLLPITWETRNWIVAFNFKCNHLTNYKRSEWVNDWLANWLSGKLFLYIFVFNFFFFFVILNLRAVFIFNSVNIIKCPHCLRFESAAVHFVYSKKKNESAKSTKKKKWKSIFGYFARKK